MYFYILYYDISSGPSWFGQLVRIAPITEKMVGFVFRAFHARQRPAEADDVGERQDQFLLARLQIDAEDAGVLRRRVIGVRVGDAVVPVTGRTSPSRPKSRETALLPFGLRA